MAFRFAPSEILSMAVELERKGIAFYEHLKSRATREDGKTMFQFLADEERRHLETFTRLLEETGETIVDESGEVSQYLGSIVETGVLSKVLRGEVSAERMGLSEALSTGIQVEKESILFYQGFLPFVPREKQHWVEEVIAEEKRHFLRLARLKEELTGEAV
ncbi:ferritin family protein [Candidatus Caldatribacterium sp. SIUC1]|uniref:ferritin family protein n=1 Tax=Candidatus Caldatribacterium sp. SIUC1 TaxID=3418365 RepID=UPI003F69368F